MTREEIVAGWWLCGQCQRAWQRRDDETCPFCEIERLTEWKREAQRLFRLYGLSEPPRREGEEG